jgi:fermentation-respiration switch protein FrsA (DUF1100 family)
MESIFKFAKEAFNLNLFFRKCSILLLLTLTSCNHIFYQPSRDEFYSPLTFGFRFENIHFKSKDGVLLNGWYFKTSNNKQKVLESRNKLIVQFHGNAENIGTHFLGVSWLIEQGYDLFVFDYRGYGKSEGEASREGLQSDALAAIEFAMSKSENLILYGQSLGGAVLLSALQGLEKEVNSKEIKSKIRGVVLESTFASYQRLARVKLSEIWFLWPFQFLGYVLVSDSKSADSHLDKLKDYRFLVVHGDKDPVVPFREGQILYEKLAGSKQFFKVDDGVHLDSFFKAQGKNRSYLLEWLSELQ